MKKSGFESVEREIAVLKICQEKLYRHNDMISFEERFNWFCRICCQR